MPICGSNRSDEQRGARLACGSRAFGRPLSARSFVEHTEGCGSGLPLTEAHEALGVVGEFLRGGAVAGGCRVQAGGDSGGDAGGHACVRWHARYNVLPAVSGEQCQ